MKKAVLIFAKNLIPGKVKTRLAATLGDEMTILIYRYLLEYTAHITHTLTSDKIVFYSNYIEKEDTWNDKIYKKQLQGGNDLGERMQNAFNYAFGKGNTEVAIIGTDCLDLTSSIIVDAFEHLESYDVVIGPARDGGYYLIAMKKLHDLLFQNISWSTDEVVKQTLAICSDQKLSVFLLPELLDIDTEQDLKPYIDRIKIIWS